MSPNTQERVTKIGETISTNAPHWMVLLAIVASFLFYMEREGARADLVAHQRIETCHDVQERSITVMDQLNRTLGQHSETLNELRDEVQRIGRALDQVIYSRTGDPFVTDATHTLEDGAGG